MSYFPFYCSIVISCFTNYHRPINGLMVFFISFHRKDLVALTYEKIGSYETKSPPGRMRTAASGNSHFVTAAARNQSCAVGETERESVRSALLCYLKSLILRIKMVLVLRIV